MKRLTIIIMMCTISLMAMAQVKLTPQAQMKIAQKKARVAHATAKGIAMAPSQQRMTLVVKVAEENAPETYSQLRAAGAEIQGKIGHQVVISIPVENIGAVSEMKGVQRIDTGHKGKWKTDIARNETGINLINGTSTTLETPYSGKGVTLCIFDTGIDFQHPAFKDAEGNSRIKCVFMIGDEGGKPFTVEDPEAGTIVFPGSVYDTPELIATLTTDTESEYHGTHTTSIAAGSVSPMGFGGMAPEADIVYIGLSEDLDEEQLMEGLEDENDIIELVLAFATAYAEQSGQPMVFSGSLNSQSGPHNGTGTVPEAIDAASATIIPVMSAGNEGGYPIHLYRKFNLISSSFKTLLALMEEEGAYTISDQSVGYTRTGDRVSVKVGLCTVNAFGKATEVWSSEELTATFGCEPQIILIDSEDDTTLSKYFDGTVSIAVLDNEDGTLSFVTNVEGTLNGLNLFQLTVSGSNGTEIDMWDDFGGFNIFELPGFVIGDSEMSGGDWTCTPNVISVGAYCTNTDYRSYDGSPLNDEGEEGYTLGDYAWFSSYGKMPNGIIQPTVSAPGVNIVSAWNHYSVDESATVLDGMQWQGYPYGAESGTSMACPVVSGIVACWLQANPSLTLDDVKEVLSETAVNDNFTTHDPIRWGYGKINAAQGIEYILNHTAIRDIQETTAANDGAIYDLQGRRVAFPTRGIYIKDGRKHVVAN
ncbi:MAG: S8 family serine peptidase [Prevotella sp.]|nr:S8 family serine peptidase [Prevotella sp.]